ncbi:MAG: dicarboxylate/amino acid:cation symporter [Oscillospiraceae bacterium]|nr:dicarboxylate/amino acid:cation symporter [Oscillospiraceae bacterium]
MKSNSAQKQDKKPFKPGLIPKLLTAIAIGILLGSLAPEAVNRVLVTLSTLFGSFLMFIIPMMILAFVTTGIADLNQGAGKLLGMTVGLSYLSTLIAGSAAYIVASNLFPYFMNSVVTGSIPVPEEGMLSPYFIIEIKPLLDVTSAIILAFILGLCISVMRNGKGQNKDGNCGVLHSFFNEFAQVIFLVLHKVIIPLLPLYICGTFANLTSSGAAFIILGVLWKVFLTVIVLHVIYLFILFFISAAIGKKNPFTMLKNQIPAYISAIGTQSSAATIPINLSCAEKNGVSKEIRNFTIPLCSNIHLPGSMITITCCVTAVLLMYEMPHSLNIIVSFIMTLGFAMVAAPGAPGGAIMSALPFLPMVGIASDGAVASLLMALYITQDSFGTACNVSGDNAMSVIVDKVYRKYLKKDAA